MHSTTIRDAVTIHKRYRKCAYCNASYYFCAESWSWRCVAGFAGPVVSPRSIFVFTGTARTATLMLTLKMAWESTNMDERQRTAPLQTLRPSSLSPATLSEGFGTQPHCGRICPHRLQQDRSQDVANAISWDARIQSTAYKYHLFMQKHFVYRDTAWEVSPSNPASVFRTTV